jgi:hypothetical protein
MQLKCFDTRQRALMNNNILAYERKRERDRERDRVEVEGTGGPIVFTII